VIKKYNFKSVLIAQNYQNEHMKNVMEHSNAIIISIWNELDDAMMMTMMTKTTTKQNM
jgi:hypothetical protein